MAMPLFIEGCSDSKCKKVVSLIALKLDGVGPVDNRPSTDELHNFVKKKVTCDMWHVTCDTWHVTCDTWHMTLDLFGGVNILSKFQLLPFVIYDIMKIWRKRLT